MSTSDSNITFKKTSFLSGINSEFINRLYSDFLIDPNSLPEGWKRFFNGLSEDEKLVSQDLNGPSWSPGKKTKKNNLSSSVIKIDNQEKSQIDIDNTKQASKDSVRAIMLIRAYRIRGHLISSLDPLSLLKKDEHPELKPETYGFGEKDLPKPEKLPMPATLNLTDMKQIINKNPDTAQEAFESKISEAYKKGTINIS